MPETATGAKTGADGPLEDPVGRRCSESGMSQTPNETSQGRALRQPCDDLSHQPAAYRRSTSWQEITIVPVLVFLVLMNPAGRILPRAFNGIAPDFSSLSLSQTG